MDRANEDRAEAAYRTLIGSRRYFDSSVEDDIDTNISDLIASLLHLADQYGGSADILEAAIRDYRGAFAHVDHARPSLNIR